VPGQPRSGPFWQLPERWKSTMQADRQIRHATVPRQSWRCPEREHLRTDPATNAWL